MSKRSVDMDASRHSGATFCASSITVSVDREVDDGEIVLPETDTPPPFLSPLPRPRRLRSEDSSARDSSDGGESPGLLGLLSEAAVSRLLERLHEAERLLGEPETVAHALGPLRMVRNETEPREDTPRRVLRINARAQLGLGRAMLHMKMCPEALEAFAAAREVSQRSRDKRDEARAVGGAASAQHYMGQYEESLTMQLEQRRLLREVLEASAPTPRASDREKYAKVCGKVGAGLCAVGRFEEAVEVLESHALDCEQEGALRGAMLARGTLCMALVELDRTDEALTCANAQMDFAQRLNDLDGMAAASGSLGALQLKRRNLGDALDAFKRQLSIYQQLGDSEGLSVASTNVSNVLRALGRFQECLEMHSMDIKMARQAGDARMQCMAHRAKANVLVSMGQHESAIQQLEYAQKCIEHINGLASELQAGHDLIADVLEAMGRTEDAMAERQRAAGGRVASSRPKARRRGSAYVPRRRASSNADGCKQS